MQQTVIYW